MSRSSPAVRAEQAARRRARQRDAGECQHPGKCGVRKRRKAVDGGTLCEEHRDALALRVATSRWLAGP